MKDSHHYDLLYDTQSRCCFAVRRQMCGDLELVPTELLLCGEQLVSVEGCLLLLSDSVTLTHCRHLAALKRLIERFFSKIIDASPKANVRNRVRSLVATHTVILFVLCSFMTWCSHP